MERVQLTQGYIDSLKSRLIDRYAFSRITGETFKVEEREFKTINESSEFFWYVPKLWYPVFRGSRFIGTQKKQEFEPPQPKERFQ